jgi:adenylate kinase family enzyme
VIQYELGRRIVITGATGSGKTTLSRRLGEALGLPVIQLDAIRHDGGWDAVDWPEMRARVEALVLRYTDGWVCEGNYSRVRDVTLSRCDTLISIDLPLRVSFWRLLQRCLRRAWTGEPLYAPDGPRETWLGLVGRQSILLWSLTSHQHRKRTTADAIAQRPADCVVYRLGTAREVAALVRATEAANPTQAGGWRH